MAEEKDTDSAPEEGVTDSGAAPSPRHGAGPVGSEGPDRSDESAELADDDAQDDDQEAATGTPDELTDDADEADPVDEFSGDADDADGASDGDAAEDGDERELVGVGAAARSGGRSGGTEGRQLARTTGRAKKDKPTPRQRTATDRPKRTTPVEFVRGSISELKKVVYPTGSQLANYFVVVLVFVALVIAIVTALDYGFGWLMLKIFA